MPQMTAAVIVSLEASLMNSPTLLKKTNFLTRSERP